MDPITTAILAAVAAGAVAGLTKTGEQAIIDAYTAIKDALARKFGADSKVVQAIKSVEEDQQSKGAPVVLQEQVAKVKADQDTELLKLAETLLDKIKAQPGGAQIIQQANGSYIAQASGGSTASVNVNQPKPG